MGYDSIVVRLNKQLIMFPSPVFALSAQNACIYDPPSADWALPTTRVTSKLLQSNQVKSIPQDYINELIIWKLKPLAGFKNAVMNWLFE